MNPLPGLIQLFTSFWLWSVVGLLSLAFSWLVNDALGKKLNRDQLDRLLDGRRYAVLYHELLQAALVQVDRWLTPRIGPSDDVRYAEGRHAWSWPLLDLSLRVALAYPLLTLVVAWSLLGTDGKLGTLVVLPTAGWDARLGALAGLAIIFGMAYLSRRAETQGKRYSSATYFVLALAFALAGFIIFALAHAGSFAGAFAVIGVCGVAFARAGAVVLAGSLAFAVAIAAGVAFEFSMAGIGVGAFAFSVVFVILFAVDVVAKRTRFALLAYAALLSVLIAALLVAVSYLPDTGQPGATLIIFLALLPLLNAVFDFFSIGLTRWQLRRGAVSVGFGAIGWALGDLASALGFFALLGLALVTMVQWLNELGAAPLLHLGLLFADIRTDTMAYWWLYMTIFSTLLPTLLHLGLASFSALLAIMPEGLALFIRRQLPRIETDAVAKAMAFWTLSTIGFLAIAAVAFGLYGLVFGVLAVFPHAGDWYLYGLEHYAAWLGVPVVPVRPGWL